MMTNRGYAATGSRFQLVSAYRSLRLLASRLISLLPRQYITCVSELSLEVVFFGLLGCYAKSMTWTTFGYTPQVGDTQYEVTPECYLTFSKIPALEEYLLTGVDLEV
jgi:hypothetical protein